MNKKIALSINKKNMYINQSPKGYGMAYFTKKQFKKGESIMMGYGKVIDHQTKHVSIQIGPKKHYISQKWTGRYLNHSCNPNCYVKTRSDGFPNIVALRKIKKDEEVTFFYGMSEFEWAKNAHEKSANCLCGGSKCRGSILSFSQLSKVEQTTLQKNRTCAKYLLGMI